MMYRSQAFQATRREHAPAVVVGLLPGIGAWGALMAQKNEFARRRLRYAAYSVSEAVVAEFLKSDTWIQGAFAIEQGFLLHRDALVGRRRWRHRAATRLVHIRLVRDRRRSAATGNHGTHQWTIADTTPEAEKPRGPS